MCESQWGAGKNELMAKSFLQKITGKLLSLSCPHYGGMGKTVKTRSEIDKNEIWRKNFFLKKKFFEKFLSHFCVPGARIGPKRPRGSQTSSFTRTPQKLLCILSQF